MNLEEFILTYNRKKVDFDGAYGSQCVDLFRLYNKEVWGNPHTGAVDGAKDLVVNYERMPLEQRFLSLVPVNRDFVKAGDVAVWNATEVNKYGHVAIVVGLLGDESLIVFEQDGFRQDGAKLNVRSIKNLLGFLRKKMC